MVVGTGVATDAARGFLRDDGRLRPALLTSPSAHHDGRLRRLADALAIPDERVFDFLTGHARSSDVTRITRELAGTGVDAIIALGGGTVSDTAKNVVAALLGDQPAAEAVPIVALPTTLSAAELTAAAGSIDAAGHKRVVWAEHLAARIAIYETDFLATTPPAVLFGTVFNAMAHCLEGLYSPSRTPITDALASSGLRMLRGRTIGSTAEQLRRLATGAVLAGLVVTRAKSGLEHAVCHALGAVAGVNHGAAHAVMLARTVRFNTTDWPGLTGYLAAAGDSSIEALTAELDAIRTSYHLPERLRDLGVPADRLTDIATATMRERGYVENVRTDVSERQLVELLRTCW
ncbi:iron-containing alcohol dehydrogenase [Dactylosporangium fulvum]|uniref:Iron-containing alcohol dehydrogenase n=1 Tax=Dactylosporangium fulvum TaxID=53359 RepID=A0ABY5VPQ7_9ACTN|nr:iron-containing alcohol dehydrogenase [Dactylosporangium fulvum]UWP79743.1 iron-containing alcohol dehydrogenase [Dactylosporangium fulvum]